MYSEVRIKNFRGLKDLSLSGLGRVNLFVGPNSVGKTSLLEAVWLLQGPGNPAFTLNLAAFRGLNPGPASLDQVWRGLFHAMTPDGQIELTGIDVDGARPSLTISLVVPSAIPLEPAPNGNAGDSPLRVSEATVPAERHLRYEYMDRHDQRFTMIMSGSSVQLNTTIKTPTAVLRPTRHVTDAETMAARFTEVQDAGAEHLGKLVQSLRLLEPRLDTLSLGFIGGHPQIRGFLGWKQPVPLQLLGEGVVRLTEILLAILTTTDGMMLIDEIETGFYYRNHETMWRALDFASSAANAQVFATTHSFECIQAAIACFTEAPDALRIFRLERDAEGDIRIVHYNHEEAMTAIDMNLEVR